MKTYFDPFLSPFLVLINFAKELAIQFMSSWKLSDKRNLQVWFQWRYLICVSQLNMTIWGHFLRHSTYTYLLFRDSFFCSPVISSQCMASQDAKHIRRLTIGEYHILHVSITVSLTTFSFSCFDSAVWLTLNKQHIYFFGSPKPVKQEVSWTMILSPTK